MVHSLKKYQWFLCVWFEGLALIDGCTSASFIGFLDPLVETIQHRCREPIQRILQHLLPRATDLRPGPIRLDLGWKVKRTLSSPIGRLSGSSTWHKTVQNSTTYSVQLHSKLVGMSFWRIEHCLQRYLNQKDRSARPEKVCQVLFKEAISDLFDGFKRFLHQWKWFGWWCQTLVPGMMISKFHPSFDALL